MLSRLKYFVAWIPVVASLQGCSLLIDSSGAMLRDLNTRQIVYDKLGPPDRVSVVDRIDPNSDEVRQFEVEHYHVHAKYNTSMPIGSWHPIAILVEPAMICYETYEAAEEIVKGHHLEFVYDQHGNTIGHRYPQAFPESLRSDSTQTNVLYWPTPESVSE